MLNNIEKKKLDKINKKEESLRNLKYAQDKYKKMDQENEMAQKLEQKMWDHVKVQEAEKK